MLLLFSKDVKHNIKMGGVKCLSTDSVQVPRNLPRRAGRCRGTGVILITTVQGPTASVQSRPGFATFQLMEILHLVTTDNHS